MYCTLSTLLTVRPTYQPTIHWSYRVPTRASSRPLLPALWLKHNLS